VALPKAFDEENFNFYGKTLQGQKEQQAGQPVNGRDGRIKEVETRHAFEARVEGHEGRIARAWD